MKKILIILILLVVAFAGLVVGGAITQGGKQFSDGRSADAGSGTNETSPSLTPADVRIGVLDPGEEPSAATLLLMKRLQALGYDTTVLSGQSASSESVRSQTTVRLKRDDEQLMLLLQRTAFVQSLFRKVIDTGQEQDIVLAAWNISDIRWDDMRSEADTLLAYAPDAVPVVVMNAGAPSGTAGEVAGAMAGVGYTQVTAENSETTVAEPAVVYYQRNYREVAKQVTTYLKQSGYASASYRYRYAQGAPIVVELGGPESE